MRKGGGQAKGAAFERECCLALSLWASKGARSDLFVRNVMSGGRFTIAMARNEDHGVPGDIAAAHPMAFDFTKAFQVECKSYKSLEWDGFLYDPPRSFLGKVIKLCQEQGARTGQEYMLIAKQNMRKPVVLMNGYVGKMALESAWPAGVLEYHFLHKEAYFVTPLRDFLYYVKPDVLLQNLDLV